MHLSAIFCPVPDCEPNETPFAAACFAASQFLLVVSIAAASCAFFAVTKTVEPSASDPNATRKIANAEAGKDHFEDFRFARLGCDGLCIIARWLSWRAKTQSPPRVPAYAEHMGFPIRLDTATP